MISLCVLCDQCVSKKIQLDPEFTKYINFILLHFNLKIVLRDSICQNLI